jgi:hypothetical protein
MYAGVPIGAPATVSLLSSLPTRRLASSDDSVRPTTLARRPRVRRPRIANGTGVRGRHRAVHLKLRAQRLFKVREALPVLVRSGRFAALLAQVNFVVDQVEQQVGALAQVWLRLQQRLDQHALTPRETPVLLVKQSVQVGHGASIGCVTHWTLLRSQLGGDMGVGEEVCEGRFPGHARSPGMSVLTGRNCIKSPTLVARKKAPFPVECGSTKCEKRNTKTRFRTSLFALRACERAIQSHDDHRAGTVLLGLAE